MYRKYWAYSIIADIAFLISASYRFILDKKVPVKSNFLDRIGTKYLLKSLDNIQDIFNKEKDCDGTN